MTTIDLTAQPPSGATGDDVVTHPGLDRLIDDLDLFSLLLDR